MISCQRRLACYSSDQGYGLSLKQGGNLWQSCTLAVTTWGDQTHSKLYHGVAHSNNLALFTVLQALTLVVSL